MIKEKKGPKLKYIYKKDQPIFSRTGERKKIKKVDQCKTIHHHRHTPHHE
jgi:hypothetical protein